MHFFGIIEVIDYFTQNRYKWIMKFAIAHNFNFPNVKISHRCKMGDRYLKVNLDLVSPSFSGN